MQHIHTVHAVCQSCFCPPPPHAVATNYLTSSTITMHAIEPSAGSLSYHMAVELLHLGMYIRHTHHSSGLEI